MGASYNISMMFNSLRKLGSLSLFSWIIVSMALPSFAAERALPDPADHSVASPTASAAHADDPAAQLDSHLREILVMRAALAGQALDGTRVSDILAVDYLDPVAVDARKASLKDVIAEKEKALKKANWSGRPPFPDLQPRFHISVSGEITLPDIQPTAFNSLLAGYESLSLQLRFLGLPLADRAAFREKETEAVRMAEARAREEEQRRLAEEEAARIAEARRAAEEKTRAARMDTDRAIARERTALDVVKSEITAYRNNLAFTREQLSLTGQERLAQLVVLRNRSSDTPVGSPGMDALYDDMVQVMQEARGYVASSLDSYTSIPPAPRYRGDLSSLSPIDEEQKASIAALKKLAGETASLADGAEALAAELSWSRLKASVAWAEEINKLRLDVLTKVSRMKRARLLGITREGIAQLKREITDITLFIRWSKAGGKKILFEEISTLKDPFVAGGLASKVFWFAFLIAVYVYVIRHGRGFLERLRGFLANVLRSSKLIRRMQQTVLIADDMFNELILLGAVLLSPYIAGFDPAHTYWHVVFAVAVWYAAYRLVIKISLHTIDWLVPGDQIGNRLLLQSILLVGRYILIINVILIVAEAILGRGYLYHIVTRIAWIGIFIIFALLIRWWRDGISEAYLKVKPSGTLAGFVLATRTRWFGFFVAIAAFGVLLIDTLAHAFRRFVYSFEQSQRMLAYLFRRRLERKALLSSEAVEVHRALPPEAAVFFDEGPVVEPSMQIDFFPHMDLFTKAVQEWKSGGHIGAFAVVGDFGFGKTTWLNEARRRADIGNTAFLALSERATTRQEALQHLASGLSAPPETGADVESLSSWLHNGEKRLIVVDDLHLWFLRSINALEALRTFNSLVELTGDRVFWLCSFSNYPYRYYSWASRDNAVFRTVVRLSAWPENTIETLLKKRTDLTGWRLSFDDLLLEEAENYPAKANPVDTAKDYNRLVWDLSLGSPRAAIQYWVSSLSVDEGGVAHVQFFKRPDGSLLDRLNERDRFILACIVWHEQVTVPEITSMLRFPSVTCRDAVLRLKETGILRSRGDYERVTAQWWPEVVRYLKRKHLVPPEA
ncbi:MAG TPA: hypothetical protein PK350_08980 [Deltaproteobacteria bacterium]|nr:hypothetical protein [Deltaproteobacteria bacterium]HPR55480.1 hypothetical protein [Deltaproteobacteria bacterium]